MKGFTAADVTDQTGKTIFITGANAGLGFEAAKVLAGKGARVLIGCRSQSRASQAVADIRAAHPDADIDIIALDLASLDSIKSAAAAVEKEAQLDVLINNAGIMVPPYELTTDGFESQFGVNHLGPFALTGLLLGKLRSTPNARVVSTASIAHKTGKIFFDDINAEKRYNRVTRYSQSKLANLLFGYELQRRLSAINADTISVIAHPGIADTELSRYVPGPLKLWMPIMMPLLNNAAEGAWPTLLAATGEHVEGGDYYGPSKLFESSGPAVKVKSTPASHNEDTARRLWELSIEMTGIDPGV
ncbi:3alpha-hydroxy bile acid-CoA-ester 3-dehydrogenase 1/3 [Halioglobus japonicus]|nr:3alpha-hydroxy bile acid-CoA-ester 3-dehydrogenase 1/3 [Halioglobus japonicus]